MKYFANQNMKIIKEIGTVQGAESVTKFLGCAAKEEGKDKPLWEAIPGVLFAHDPDGYLLEIFPSS